MKARYVAYCHFAIRMVLEGMHNDFRSVIDRWPKPSISQFADDVGIHYVTAQVMRHRNSISPDHWPAVVDAAQRRGFREITLDLLCRLRAERSKRLRVGEERAA